MPASARAFSEDYGVVGGTVTPNNGAGAAAIALLGHYMAANFAAPDHAHANGAATAGDAAAADDPPASRLMRLRIRQRLLRSRLSD